jgi:hypothetical protein
MNDQNPPPPPEPTWTERQLARAAKPEPMRERDYAHLVRVHDEPESATDPLTGQKVAARLSPEAASYLGFLRACPAPRMAREAAGVSSGSVANWRRQIEGFAALEREAVQDAKDTLLASAYNRAVHGVVKPVFRRGAPAESDEPAEAGAGDQDRRTAPREHAPAQDRSPRTITTPLPLPIFFRAKGPVPRWMAMRNSGGFSVQNFREIFRA